MVAKRSTPMRVAALWFPDWPIQAAWLGEETAEEEVLIAQQHRVQACSLAARKRGIRRGMRVRQAQALAPGVVVLNADIERDARLFEPIVAGLDEVASSIEVLRPGLALVEMGAVIRFYGGQERGVEKLLNAAVRRGVDVNLGVADEIATAVIAARQEVGAIVAPGGSRQFLAAQSMQVLAAESALGCDTQVVDSLRQLGLSTLGDLAQLSKQAVTTRFGTGGMRCYEVATAQKDRVIAPALPVADYAVALYPEEAIERVDAAAFAARNLAAQLHEKLAAAGLSVLRLKVRAELVDGTALERVWRTKDPLEEQASADRVRWQLDSWLSSGGAGAISALVLEPVELRAPEHSASLWGAGAGLSSLGQAERAERARRVLARVQSSLGIDAVVRPRLCGGRGVEERVEFIPVGEQRDPVPAGSWPGQIPPPLPARLGGGPAHPAARILLLAADATPVNVTAQALLSAQPYALRWGKAHFYVTAWAGPWPVDDQWWVPGGLRLARMQVVGRKSMEADPQAWLLLWVGGTYRWRVEACYD